MPWSTLERINFAAAYVSDVGLLVFGGSESKSRETVLQTELLIIEEDKNIESWKRQPAAPLPFDLPDARAVLFQKTVFAISTCKKLEKILMIGFSLGIDRAQWTHLNAEIDVVPKFPIKVGSKLIFKGQFKTILNLSKNEISD